MEAITFSHLQWDRTPSQTRGGTSPTRIFGIGADVRVPSRSTWSLPDIMEIDYCEREVETEAKGKVPRR